MGVHYLDVVGIIWSLSAPRSPKDIDDEEYNRFYEMFSRDSKEPMAKTHFVAEGEVTFRSILFVPGVSNMHGYYRQ